MPAPPAVWLLFIEIYARAANATETVTSTRGLAEKNSGAGGEAAKTKLTYSTHEWHQPSGASARKGDRVHNPGVSLPIRLDRQRFPHSPTKHYHATFPAPTGQLQFARQPLPAPSGRLPIVASEQSRNMPFHLRRLPDLEQVRQSPFLALHHHGFRAPADISPHQCRPLLTRPSIQPRPQSRLCILGSRLITRLHFHLQHHPDGCDEISLVHVRGPSLFGRVVSENRVPLLPIQSHHGPFHVQNQRLAQQLFVAGFQMGMQPALILFGFPFQKSSPHRVFAPYPFHP